MSRTTTLAVAATALLSLGFTVPPDLAVAGPETLKDQLVGTWSLMSWEELRRDGSKVRPLWGSNTQGILMFDGQGHFSFQAISQFPKFASNDRKRTTPAENQALSQSVYAYFGRYAVNEAQREIIVHIERSTFPNMSGTNSRRVITSLTGDELKYNNPATLSGRQTYFVWKRVQEGPRTAAAAPTN
jgi:Lipocalin-like domain